MATTAVKTNGTQHAAESEESFAQINLARVKAEIITIPIRGTAPLIVNRWSEKAKEMMLGAQQGKKAAKQHRDPAADFEASQYRMEDGRHGFPAVAFKSAIVTAARLFQGVTMTQLRPIITVLGDGAEQLVPLDGECTMREDMVRNSGRGGVADFRFRAQYWPWSANLVIRFRPQVISVDSLYALVDAGGEGGVGEWRPASKMSNTGTYGTFEVVA